MTSEVKIFTFEEVSKHNKKDDCWMIISGKVYDVTPFMDDHPGGDEVMVLATEKDATEDFEDVGHSENARIQMKDFYVGDVDLSTIPDKKKYVAPSKTSTSTKGSGSSSSVLQYFLPLLILVLAFAYYKFAKKD